MSQPLESHSTPRSRRPFAGWAAGFAAVLFLLVAAPPALACSCIPPGSPVASMEQADAVFAAKVVSVAPEETAASLPSTVHVNRMQRRKVVFELDRVWKGCEAAAEAEEAPHHIELTTGAGGGDCGFDFMVGESYMVYAFATADGSLVTSICSRTRHLRDAAEDVASLGEPLRTAPSSDDE